MKISRGRTVRLWGNGASAPTPMPRGARHFSRADVGSGEKVRGERLYTSRYCFASRTWIPIEPRAELRDDRVYRRVA